MINFKSVNKWLAVADETNGSSDQHKGFHAELASSWDEKMIPI
jgi:hypothetical protein